MTKQTIGAFLQTLRKAKGYTQQEVADQLGISNRTLSAWENDKAYPDLLSLPALADLYGVTADEILRGERTAENNADGENERTAEINRKRERAALKNRLMKFTAQNYILLIPVCTAALFWAICPSVDWGLIFLILAIVLLITAAVLRFVFFQNAETAADLTNEPTPLQIKYRRNLRAVLRRCLKIEAAVFSASGIFALFFLMSTQFAVSLLAAVLAAVPLLIGIGLAVFCFLSANRDVEEYDSDEQKAAAKKNKKLLRNCLAGGAGTLALVVILATVLSLETIEDRILLYSGTEEELRTELQTIVVEKGSSCNTLYGVEAGRYYLDLPSYDEALSDYTRDTDMEYTFPVTVNNTDYTFAASFSPNDSGNLNIYLSTNDGRLLVSEAYTITLLSGTTVFNARYCAEHATYDGDCSFLDQYGEDFAIEADENGSYCLYSVQEYTLSLSLSSIAFWIACILLCLLVPAIVYFAKRKQIAVPAL